MAGGVLLGVQNNNGAEQTVDLGFIPVVGNVNHYLIVIGMDGVEFWINNVLRGEIATPASLGSPTQSNSLPILLRNYNSSTVSSAIQFNVGQIAVTNGDMDMGKDWATNMVTNGLSSISAPDGQTAALSANYANSAAPATGSLANITASYATLGGQFQFAAVAGAETDFALFGYLNPAATAAVPGKNLVITGVRIDTFNTVVAVATTATVIQWVIGVGSTAVSLATADSATAGTRAPRKLPLGTQTFAVGAGVGAVASTIDVNFITPLMVEPGTYCHIIMKVPIGTATATEIFRGVVMINGFFE